MCSWSYDIVDACSIDREIACIGMSYFDRFMGTYTTSSNQRAKSALLSRREFQLAFIACLILALKCRAGMQVDSDFVSDTICQGMYEPEEMVDMEKEILSALGWRLNGPSAQEFVSGLLELVPSLVIMRDNAKVVESLKTLAARQVEVAMLDYNMALQTSSSIAYAALLMAMSSMSSEVFHPLDRLAWMQNITMVTGLKADDVSSRVVCDRLFEVSQPSSTPRSNSGAMKNDDRAIMMCTPDRANAVSYTTPGMEQEICYCSPVSSEDSSIQTEHPDYSELYCDVLSMASTASSSDLSPVCAMLDGRLEIQSYDE